MKRERALVHSGDRFGRLTLVEEVEKKSYNRRFLCKCDCGNFKVIDLSRILSGNTKSCGCLRKEMRTKENIKHGLSKHPLYHVWCSMKGRCFNKTDQSYKNYGERGIRVCIEWLDFETFYNWAFTNGYKKGLTIERKDFNGNYEPGNCKWILFEEQSKNRRSNHWIEFNGKVQTMSQWAVELGLRRETIKDRLESGWSIEKALTTQIKHKEAS